MTQPPLPADDARARTRAIEAKRARQRRTQFALGGLVTVLAMGATAVVLTKATAETSGCTALESDSKNTGGPVSLIIELEGNTARDAAAAAEFVAAQLHTSASDIESAFDVTVVLVAYGDEAPVDGCLAQARRIASPRTDLKTYQADSTSADTKEHLSEVLRNKRTEQISWIVDEVATQVRGVDFRGRDSDAPQLSPRLAWNAALSHDGPDTILAVMSPMISTVDDCFAIAGKPVGEAVAEPTGATGRVDDCKQFGEIDEASAQRTSIVAHTDDLDAQQRRLAMDTAEQMCAAVTTDDCSAAPDNSERGVGG